LLAEIAENHVLRVPIISHIPTIFVNYLHNIMHFPNIEQTHKIALNPM